MLAKHFYLTEYILMEEIRDQTETTQTPLEVVEDYLNALRGNDISEYERVDGTTSNVLYKNSEFGGYGDGYTLNVIRQAKIYELEPTFERAKLLNSSKTAAAIKIVRGMIQGKQIPIEEFTPVIDRVIFSVNMINGFLSDRRAKHLIRSEIRNVWSFKSRDDPEYMRRTAEAYKCVGRPLLLGESIIKLAGINFTQH